MVRSIFRAGRFPASIVTLVLAIGLHACSDVAVDNRTMTVVGEQPLTPGETPEPGITKAVQQSAPRSSLRLGTLVYENGNNRDPNRLDTIDLDIGRTMDVMVDTAPNGLPTALGFSMHARIPERLETVTDGSRTFTANTRGIRELTIVMPKEGLDPSKMNDALECDFAGDPVSGAGAAASYQYDMGSYPQRLYTRKGGVSGGPTGKVHVVVRRVDPKRRMSFVSVSAKLVNPVIAPERRKDIEIKELWLGIGY
jgi:hypothetical protein